MRHLAPQDRRLRRMRRPDDGAHGGIAVAADAVFAPLFHQRAHVLVHRFAVFQPQVLQLAAGGIGGLDQHEDALAATVHLLQKGLDAVRAQIAVDGEKIGIEGAVFFAANLRLTEVRLGVARGSGADVVALGIRHDDEALGRRIAAGLIEGVHPLDAVHLVIGDLHLDGGDDVADGIDEGAVEGEHRLCGAGEIVDARAHPFGKIVEGGIQPHDRRVVAFLYLIYQRIDDHTSPLNSARRIVSDRRGWRERALCRQ